MNIEKIKVGTTEYYVKDTVSGYNHIEVATQGLDILDAQSTFEVDGVSTSFYKPILSVEAMFSAVVANENLNILCGR